MRNIFYAAMMLFAGATPSLAAQTTVNSVTPSQEAKAKSAIVQAGYKPGALQSAQDGNLFFTATKGNDFYTVTVARGGEVYASTGLPIQGAATPAG